MVHARRRFSRFLTLLVPLALIASACGGSSNGGSESEAGDPVRGGAVTYALEADTGDGWCLPEAQLAISGIMVARTLYDTLTAPNAAGEYEPYLAESVEPNDTYDEWTITLRPDVTFHDGTPLTAEVVKNNLDAYRGAYEGRSPLLFIFVLDNIAEVEVTGDLEVTVSTEVPWVAFDSFLFSSGRLGIVGQAQLDDAENCDRNLIGTGPFMLDGGWTPGQDLTAVRNPDYWQIAPDDEPYPYLEQITYTAVVESEQRVNGVESGNFDLAHLSGAPDLINIRNLAEDGAARSYESEDFAEVSFVQLNTSRAPMDDHRVREAAALAVDPEDYTEVINRGEFTMASGPFGPGSIGYLEDSGYPKEQDLDRARSLIAEYEEENGPISITYQATPGALTQQVAVYVQQQMEEIGVDVQLQTVQQDQLIDNAIGGDYDIMGFRNYPGGDPDELYVWFKGGSPVNFSRFQDEEIDRLLDEGRSEPDPDRRREIYEDVNRRFGEQYWSIWANWTTWMIASQPNVYGYSADEAPQLPSGGDPFPGLAAGHQVHGIWVES